MNIYSIIFTILFGGLAVAIAIFLSRLRFAMRKGKFLLMKNIKDFLSFSSDYGNFHIKFREQTLFANLINTKKTILLKELAGIRYKVDDEPALYTEKFGAKGSDFNDLIHWYNIKLILKDRTEIPLFIAGEFEHVDWLWKWQSKIEKNAFERAGLVADVDAHLP